MTRKISLTFFILLISAIGLYATGSHEPRFTNWDQNSTHQYGINSVRVASSGNIEVSEDGREITSIESGAILYIEEKKLFKSIEVLIRGTKEGKQEINVWVNGVRKNLDDSIMYDISVLLETAYFEFGLGAVNRVFSEFEKNGTDAAVEIIRKIDSSSIQEYLIDTLIEKYELDQNQLITLLSVSDSVESSSTLRHILQNLSKEIYNTTSDPEAIDALLTAVNDLHSSSDKQRILMYYHNLGFSLFGNPLFLEAVENIPASTDRKIVLVEILEDKKLESDELNKYLLVIQSIPSSSDQRTVMNILDFSSYSDENQRRLIETLNSIHSSSDQRLVLEEMAANPDLGEVIIPAFLEAVRDVPSSSDQREALTTLMVHRSIPSQQFSQLFETISEISSSMDQQEIILTVLKHQALDQEGIIALLDMISTIPSSSAQRTVVLKLIEWVNTESDSLLKKSAIKDAFVSAIGSIAGMSDREACMKMLLDSY